MRSVPVNVDDRWWDEYIAYGLAELSRYLNGWRMFREYEERKERK